MNPEQIHSLWNEIIRFIHRSSATSTATTTIIHQFNHKVYIDKSLFIQTVIQEQGNHQTDETSQSSNIHLANLPKTSGELIKFIQVAIDDGFLVENTETIQSDRHAEEHQLANGDIQNGTSCESKEPGTLISLPFEHGDGKQVRQSSHDWYCFECHQAVAELDSSSKSSTQLYKCKHCWRSFHGDCAQLAYEVTVNIEPTPIDTPIATMDDNPFKSITASTFKCPVCSLHDRHPPQTISQRQFQPEEFNEIISYSFQRFQAKSNKLIGKHLKLEQLVQECSASVIQSSLVPSKSSHQDGNHENGLDVPSKTFSPNELTSHLAMHHLVHHRISMDQIETNLLNSSYTSISEFLGDCLTFIHAFEVAIIAGLDHLMPRKRSREALLTMLRDTRYELKEMLICVDCYANSNRRQMDKLWFCRPCSPPHMLVFAKQRGFPYWPAKVIIPRIVTNVEDHDKFDVRFFGGNHERSVVELSNIKVSFKNEVFIE